MDSPGCEEIDELEVIAAIYPEVCVDQRDRRLTITSSDEQSTEVEERVVIYCRESKPRFEISAPSMERSVKRHLANELAGMLVEGEGRPLHEVVEHVLDFFKQQRVANSASSSLQQCGNDEAAPSTHAEEKARRGGGDPPKIFSGEPMEDRRSVFQAHVARIKSQDEAMRVLRKLKENGKIAKATHNIYAWRTTNVHPADGRRVEQHDCDDDGEHGAGSKLLHLLTMMKADDLVVVVTRWYGGRQLGPDRFRHICNVARECVTRFGFIKQ